MFRHILVPSDGSALSERAVNKAVALAKETGAKLTFFFSQTDSETSVYGDAALLRTVAPTLLAETVNRQARDILAVAVAAAQVANVVADAKLAVSGEPFEAIIAAAEQCGCDLILMASHGHRGIKGLLLGSQTQKVLSHSKLPVLVYR